MNVCNNKGFVYLLFVLCSIMGLSFVLFALAFFIVVFETLITLIRAISFGHNANLSIYRGFKTLAHIRLTIDLSQIFIFLLFMNKISVLITSNMT